MKVFSIIPLALATACASQELPFLVADDLRIAEGNSPRELVVGFELSEPAPREASARVELIGQTATAGEDFSSYTGTVNWEKGQKQAEIRIEILGDTAHEPDESLWVSFSEPKGTLLPNPFFTLTLENDDAYSGADSGFVSPTSYPGYSLVWSDEFDGSVLNTESWNYETGNSGWGNNELQFYRSGPSNVRLENGRMIITARKESFSGADYTSARITTQGKREFQYGRIDIRAKLPKGQGIWPALWMLGANFSQVGWPACGETDIMELIGHQPNKVHATAHWGAQVPIVAYLSPTKRRRHPLLTLILHRQPDSADATMSYPNLLCDEVKARRPHYANVYQVPGLGTVRSPEQTVCLPG